MSFEPVVLEKVTKIVKSDSGASFFCGSLSVACTEKEARQIFYKLSDDYGLGKVQVKPNGSHGYLFDFVA